MFANRMKVITRAGVGAAVLATGFGLALFTAPTLASASERPSMAICNTLHAAHWKTAHKSGNTWYVTVTSPTTCGFAEKAGAVLTHLKLDSTGNFAKSPKGYTCGGAPFGGRPQNFACHQNSGTGEFDVTITGM